MPFPTEAINWLPFQIIEDKPLFIPDVLFVQVMPSGDVTMLVSPPATSRFPVHAMMPSTFVNPEALSVQVMPSGDVKMAEFVEPCFPPTTTI